MSNKIISQETKAIIDSALAEAKNYFTLAAEQVQIAETKAVEARASYEVLVEMEGNVDNLITKTSLTENEFLKIVGEGRQAEMTTGTEITLPNSLGTTNVWVVADVNHDNTTGTVDLVAKNLIQDSTTNAYSTNGGIWGPTFIYSNSTIRNWLINTYITGFSSAIQSALKTMNVDNVDDTGSNIKTTKDKIKLLSCTELRFNPSSMMPSTAEGSAYPIFSYGTGSAANTKRVKYKADGTTASWYWTRTRSADAADCVCVSTVGGDFSRFNRTRTDGGIVPVIRF